jgi:hypothetical protein
MALYVFLEFMKLIIIALSLNPNNLFRIYFHES